MSGAFHTCCTDQCSVDDFRRLCRSLSSLYVALCFLIIFSVMYGSPGFSISISFSSTTEDFDFSLSYNLESLSKAQSWSSLKFMSSPCSEITALWSLVFSAWKQHILSFVGAVTKRVNSISPSCSEAELLFIHFSVPQLSVMPVYEASFDNHCCRQK